jgi:hypothetical protein
MFLMLMASIQLLIIIIQDHRDQRKHLSFCSFEPIKEECARFLLVDFALKASTYLLRFLLCFPKILLIINFFLLWSLILRGRIG